MTEFAAIPDLGKLYNAARLRFTASVQALDDESLAKRPPATADWTVKDLAGHAAGVVSDVTAGKLDGAGSDAWTAEQVEAAKPESLETIFARWDEQAPALETLLSAAPPSMMTARLVIDMVTHEFDLAGATGESPDTGAAYVFARDGYASAFARRVAKAELPAIELAAADWSVVAGEGSPAVRASADEVEIFRALSGRRSTAQVLAWKWEGDPAPYLPLLSNFGELAKTDVIEAFR